MPKARAWTDEQLAEAVRSSTSWAGVARSLGIRPTGGNHYTMKAGSAALGLDTSHLVAAVLESDKLRIAIGDSKSIVEVVRRLDLALDSANYQRVARAIRNSGLDTAHFVATHSPNRGRVRRWTDEQLRDAVLASISCAGVLRMLGLVPAGGNYTQVQRRIRELALDVSHFTGAGWDVGSRFKALRPAVPIEEVLVSGRWTKSHKLKLRLFKLGLKTPACELCGWAARSPDGRVPVELDHANGDHDDNRLENLRILCPNCHSLQPTHRGLNQRRRRR